VCCRSAMLGTVRSKKNGINVTKGVLKRIVYRRWRENLTLNPSVIDAKYKIRFKTQMQLWSSRCDNTFSLLNVENNHYSFFQKHWFVILNKTFCVFSLGWRNQF
jgi:hypothetical protein